ncbi:hypothetical protein [Streptomyces sp. NPDC001750]
MSARRVFGLPDPPILRLIAGIYVRDLREAKGLPLADACRLPPAA